jgi:hypothetical protein
MCGRPTRPSGQFQLLSSGNSALRLLTRPPATRVPISTRMMFAAMGDQIVDRRV